MIKDCGACGEPIFGSVGVCPRCGRPTNPDSVPILLRVQGPTSGPILVFPAPNRA